MAAKIERKHAVKKNRCRIAEVWFLILIISMSDVSQNNKRIAKNTLLLYSRMFFMMAVSLYTSRVVLNTLGVEDYGIYNVVGGIVAMFSFINSSMSAATQRYITFALGKDDKVQLKKVFNTSLIIHGGISILLILLAETIGLWFLWNKMQVPVERMEAAFWVYQSSIVASVIMIMSVPYNAAIVAHEKMSAFAYISVLEVVLKLLIVYLLLVISFDKLIVYALLIVLVQIFIRLCYSWYCNKYFKETLFTWILDRGLIKEMIGFAGWNLFGACAYIAFTQGLNIILNMFFGPVVNAARAIAVQVQNAMTQFISNFQMALNPQIIKSYAAGDLQYMHSLIYRSSKFSYFLIFSISLPVIIETPFILKVWLNNVPENSAIFLRLMVCTSWISSISNPLINAAQATGNIRKYQTVIGTMLIMILPISYLCLKIGFPACSVFIVHLIIECLAQVVRLFIIKPMIELSIGEFVKNVILKIILVSFLTILLPYYVHTAMHGGWLRLVFVAVASFLSATFIIGGIGLSTPERKFILTTIRKRMHCKKNLP